MHPDMGAGRQLEGWRARVQSTVTVERSSPIHRRAYASAGLSVGFTQAALVSSEAGRLTAVLVGGIGFMNHLS